MSKNNSNNQSKIKPHLSTNARLILERRFLKKDDSGKITETPFDMMKRVAENIASADKNYGKKAVEIKKTVDEFLEVMINLEFLSGMTLRNAGRELQQLSACYVLPIDDSMESIFETLKNAAFLHKTGAGIGYDFSSLRPRGSLVKSTGGTSSGPVSFMRLFDFSTETVVSTASTRRGGNMGILRIDHPNIMEFITIKEDLKELNNFNLSVAITDKFMEAVEKGQSYDLIDPHNNKKVKSLAARQVFELIVEKAHAAAEPGIIFIDRINEFNQTPQVGRIEATNLCGEQPLLPYEACNIGSLVLSRMLKENAEGEKEVDFDKLAQVIKIAVHFLDNTIDVNKYPLPQIEEINLANRKIGLGVMGFADALIEIGIPYNSQEAVNFISQIMEFISLTAREASVELAKERKSFPNFKKSIWPKKGFKQLRNATVTTIAPNGTTSIIANCSSGIEPIFALVYVRKNILDLGKDELLEIHPLFETVAKDNWFYSQELMEEVSKQGSIQGLDKIPLDIQRIFVTSHDIEPEWHARIQAAAQKYTDNAVSKTVNLPQDATTEDVEKIFKLAYQLGCKGVTIYRDKSRDKQVLNVKD